jgi:hypothetical protein
LITPVFDNTRIFVSLSKHITHLQLPQLLTRQLDQTGPIFISPLYFHLQREPERTIEIKTDMITTPNFACNNNCTSDEVAILHFFIFFSCHLGAIESSNFRLTFNSSSIAECISSITGSISGIARRVVSTWVTIFLGVSIFLYGAFRC